MLLHWQTLYPAHRKQLHLRQPARNHSLTQHLPTPHPFDVLRATHHQHFIARFQPELMVVLLAIHIHYSRRRNANTVFGVLLADGVAQVGGGHAD